MSTTEIFIPQPDAAPPWNDAAPRTSCPPAFARRSGQGAAGGYVPAFLPPEPDDFPQPGNVVTVAVTDDELALLEVNAYSEDPGFDCLAAKVKAARAGDPASWREYLICTWDEDAEGEAAS